MSTRARARRRRGRRRKAAPAVRTIGCNDTGDAIAPNPFLQPGAVDTVQHVKCGLKLYAQMSAEGINAEFDKDVAFGQFLFLQSMILALEAVQEQMTNEPKERKHRARGRA